jgi:SAM-dependent methyltransferase
MTTPIDALTSPTLKHLREAWWDDEFTEFLAETLKPRPGNRILDVGCGEGVAEVSLRRLQISQLKLFGVAVLQHVGDLDRAVRECTRVTRPGGRIVMLEPDNSSRYFYSSVPTGQRAADTARLFFVGLAAARSEAHDGVVGPLLPGLLARHGVEPVDVRLFPVSSTWLGDHGAIAWQERRDAVNQLLEHSPWDGVRRLGAAHLAALEAYETEARAAGPTFVEIQHTMLFATVGERPD